LRIRHHPCSICRIFRIQHRTWTLPTTTHSAALTPIPALLRRTLRIQSNVTSFRSRLNPVGNSPMVSAFSSNTMKGVPSTWDTTLFDTGKSTLLKITVPAIVPRRGLPLPTRRQSSSHRNRLAFSHRYGSIRSRRASMFRPVQELKGKPVRRSGLGQHPMLYLHHRVYAEYQTAAETIVTITSSLRKRTPGLF